jgi:hypothetical protein
VRHAGEGGGVCLTEDGRDCGCTSRTLDGCGMSGGKKGVEYRVGELCGKVRVVCWAVKVEKISITVCNVASLYK